MIDATTDTIAATVALPGGVSAIAFNPVTNKLYVMQPSQPNAQILVLDGATLAQTAIVAGVQNGPLVVNPANGKIYAACGIPAGGGALAFGVAVIDGSKDAVIATIQIPNGAHDLIVNPVTNNVYAKPPAAQNNPDLTVYELDGAADQLIETISSPFAPQGFNDGFQFVDAGANKIYSGLAIDGTTGAVTQGLPAFSFPFGSSVPVDCQFTSGFAIDFALGNMYAGCDARLLIADLHTGAINAQVPLNYIREWQGLIVNPLNHAVYGIGGFNTAIFDPVALTGAWIPLAAVGGGVSVNATTNRVYAIDGASSAAVVIDGSTNNVTARVFAQIGGLEGAAFQIDSPRSIAVNTVKNQFVVGGSASAMVMDGLSDAPLVPVAPQILAGNPPAPVVTFNITALNEATNRLYSTGPGFFVNVTDLQTGTVSVFTSPALKPGEICSTRGLAVNSVMNWVYVTAVCQTASPILLVYDGTTASLLQTADLGAFIPLGSNVGDITLNPKTNKLYIVNYGGFNPQTDVANPPGTEVYNAVTFAHLASIPGVVGPMTIDTTLNTIYGTSATTNATVVVINGSTDTLSGTFASGTVTSLAANAATGMIYVMNGGLGLLSVFQGDAPAPGTFTVSGSVTGSAGNGIAGVSVAVEGGVTSTVVTDASGQFTLSGISPGAYTVAPTSAGFFYSPASKTINITTANATGIAFAALSTPIAVTSLTLSPWNTIASGVTTTATATLNQPAPAGGITLNLSTSTTKPAKVPATVTIPAGSTSASYSVQTSGVTSPTATTLIATYQGSLAPQASSATVGLTVDPGDTVHITSATWSKSTQLLQVTATSTNPQALLVLFLSSGNQTLGNFTSAGNGIFTIKVPFTTGTPSSVTVKSNLGGQTGQGVTTTP